MIDTTTIDAIGKLSVEVVAILTLGISLFMQAKASMLKAKEMSSLTKAIYAFVKESSVQNEKVTEVVREVKVIARQNTEMLQEHHAFAQKLAKKFQT